MGIGAGGQALTVGIRPQAFQVAGAGTQAAITLQVPVVEYLGTESQVVGHLAVPGGQRVTATVAGDAQALLHGALGLAVDPDAVHVFDSESGRSLRT